MLKQTTEIILEAIQANEHTGCTLAELHSVTGYNANVLHRHIITLLDMGKFIKIAGGYIYASEFTSNLKTDNDGSISLMKPKRVQTQESTHVKNKTALPVITIELDTLQSREVTERAKGLDTLINLVLCHSKVDYSDIVLSVARVMTSKAQAYMVAESPDEGYGFAGCLLRDSAKLLDAVTKMEN